MQTNHANAIKGLSIAVIILAALGIVSCLIGMFSISALAPYMEYSLEYSDGYYTYSDDALAAQLMMSVGNVMLGWVLVCCIITLVAGIMGLRNYNNPQKLGTVFGWSIVGAILSFIGGSIITCVLLVIAAVFANKDKQMAVASTYDPTVPAAAPTMPTMPVQPAAAPVQPAATPVQPVATPEQTAATVTPVQPAATPVVGAVEVTETVVEETSNQQ